MASLITITNRWSRLSQSTFERGQDKRQFQALIQLPTDHVARVPIQHGYQIHPAASQADVRDIQPPNMIGILAGRMTQKIGKDAFLLRAFAQIRTRMDPLNAHLTHVSLDRFSVDLHSFQLELSRNLS